MKALWKDEDLTDVTLVTSDGGRQLKAHKIILSSASSLLNNILLRHKHQNPLIFLHSIHLGMLEQILEFIYTGRCEIHQDNLKMFLSCGKALGIQRLAGYAKGETENTFKIEKPIESDYMIDKCTNKDNFEEMEQLQMSGAVDMEQIRSFHSEDKINDLGKCTNEENSEEMNTMEMEQIKSSGSKDKHLEGVMKQLEHMKKHSDPQKPKAATEQKRKLYYCTICDYKTNRPIL